MKIDTNKIRISKEKIIILVLTVSVVILASFSIFTYREARAGILSPQAAAQKAVDYINSNLLKGKTASLGDVQDKGQVYEFTLKIDKQKYNSYVTKDGKFIFPEGYEITTRLSKDTEIPKRDKPDVKLFVMSYCPFGLQAEKMFLPVYDLLKSQASMEIYFVDYAMHGKKEIDENLRQYCIEKEENNKYPDYLSCFTKSGDSATCLSTAKVDTQKIDQCVSATDKEYHITEDYNNKSTWLSGRYPVFNVYKDLNEKYGVQGSPTIVINDAVIVTDEKFCPEEDKKCVVLNDFTRSPESFKKVVCSAFNSQPSVCSQKLSDKVSSIGIGEEEGSNNSSGSCE